MSDGAEIALLNPYFWPEVRRGSERMMRDLALGLVAEGDRPTVITAGSGRPAVTHEGGVRVVRNRPLPERPLRVVGYHEPVGHIPASYRSLIAGDFDLAHAFYPTDALAALAWARRRRRPLVFSVMGIPDARDIDRRRPRRRLWETVTRASTRLVVLSEAARTVVTELFGVESTVVYPGVNLAAFMRVSEPSPVPTVLCPAAIDDPRKRVPALVEAFMQVHASRPDARLVLSRSANPKVNREMAAHPGIELRVLDRHADLLRAYSEAWVTALVSHSEAFGLVLVESLACGTPVIGSREGGIPEAVGSVRGNNLVAFDDPDALGVALDVALAGPPSDDDRGRCRQQAERFSVERCVDAHRRLYAGL